MIISPPSRAAAYVGGWLTAWIKNHPQGMRGVLEELRRRARSHSESRAATDSPSSQLSATISPRRPAFTSVDSWTLIATYLRNIFLNWLVLISWLAAAMMVPRLYLTAILLPPTGWAILTGLARIVQHYDIALNVLLAVEFCARGGGDGLRDR